MNINSLQGSTAYTNAPSATPPVDNTQRNQNAETSITDLKSDSAAAPKAFEVTITQEAQNRLAAQKTPAPNETKNTTPENQTGQNMASGYEKSQIMNIVA